MSEYESSNEGKLWHAVLMSYFVDASLKNLDEHSWRYILGQANSHWTKAICEMICLNHSFFIAKLIATRNARGSVRYANHNMFMRGNK